MTTSATPNDLAPGASFDLKQLVDYAPGSVVSRTLTRGAAGTLTLFAFDAGQGLSEHSAPFDAWVFVLDGSGTFTIGGRSTDIGEGQGVLMPADVPHAVNASTRFKMLLVMLKHGAVTGTS